MLKYTLDAAKTIALFFKHKNEIDVYYEDANDEEFYLELLHRMSLNLKIEKLHPLGSKKNVIEACKSDQSNSKRRRLYIVDGDLDLINDTNPKDLKYLHVHDAYCIENLILDEHALIEIMHDECTLSREKIKTQLKYDDHLKEAAPHLVELFIHYAISYQTNLGLPTISQGVERFCQTKNNKRKLNPVLVQNQIDKLREEIIKKLGEDFYEEAIEDKRKKWFYDKKTLLRIVSAKHYLIPIIINQTRRVKTKRILSKNYLRMRLVKLCAVENFAALRKALIA